MNLACTRLELSPAEALSACTANAAHVLGLNDVGRLASGYRADVLVLDAPDWRYLALPPRRRSLRGEDKVRARAYLAPLGGWRPRIPAGNLAIIGLAVLGDFGAGYERRPDDHLPDKRHPLW
jgi:Amidohydrolase family